MNKRNYALQPWLQYSDGKMDTDAPIALDKIASMPAFAELAAEVTTVNDLYKDYRTALAAARLGNKGAIETKNELKANLGVSMNLVSVSVTKVAKNNRALLIETTLPVNKISPSSPVPQEKPDGVNVSAGKSSGQALVTIMDAKGADSLMYQYTMEQVTPTSIWVSRGGASSKSYLFTDLPVGARVWFRVVSVGKNKNEIMSDMVSLIIN